MRKLPWRFIVFVMFILLMAAGYIKIKNGQIKIHQQYLEFKKPTGILPLSFPKSVHPFEHRSIIELENKTTNLIGCHELSAYMKKVNYPCWDRYCRTDYPKMLEDNLAKVTSYPQDGVDKLRKEMLWYIEATRMTSVQVGNNSVVIVTAINSRFFHPLQGLLHMLHNSLLQHYVNVHLIVYDLGLRTCERKFVQKYCRCEIKDFPYWLFPESVKNLKSFAWKPLIIQLESLQHKFVVWMDTSIRFHKQNLQQFFQDAINKSVMVAQGDYSMAQQTDLQMFRWFQEEPCLFSGFHEVQAGFVTIYRTPFTSEMVLRPWVACALEPSCILPRSAVDGCAGMEMMRYGKCHRHDQSALSIILTRLFRQARKAILLAGFNIRKRENVYYFPRQPSWFCRPW